MGAGGEGWGVVGVWEEGGRRNSSTLFLSAAMTGSPAREVHFVIRVRHNETDVSLDLVEHPAPIGGGEPSFLISGVSHHSRKFPTRRFPQRSFCLSLEHLMMAFTTCIVHGSSMAGAVARMCSNHCASIAGSSSTPRGIPRATIRRRIESRSRPVVAPSLRKRLSSPIIFALARHRADDEKTPSKVRQENMW